MIKRTISLLLITVILLGMLSLTSCHGKKSLDPFVMPEAFDPDQSIEITFWTKNDNHTAQKNIFNRAVSEFEELYPNINVTTRSMYNYDDIYKDVLTNIRTGTTPNICITYPDHVASYLSGTNIIVPLKELINDESYGFGGTDLKFDAPDKKDLIEKYMSEGVINGTQYTIPFMRSTEACYINLDLVEALGYSIPKEGLTWEFIFEVSNKAMQPVGTNDKGEPIYINGMTTLVPFVYKSTDNMMIQLLKQKGYGYSNENGEMLIFNDDTKEVLYMIADNIASGAFSTFDIANAYPGDLLNKGMCIFGVDSTAGATWMGSSAPNMDIKAELVVDFEMGVSPIPQIDTENPQMISQGPSICIFNKENPMEVLASWLFVQYLLTDEIQIAFSQTEGYVPVTSSAQNAPEYTDYLSRAGEDNDMYYDVKIAATKIILDNIENTFITPVFNGSASLRKAAGLLIEETGKSVNRGTEINDGQIEKLYQKSISMYKLDELTYSDGEKKVFVKLPAESIALISVLTCIWCGMGTYFVVQFLRKKRNK